MDAEEQESSAAFKQQTEKNQSSASQRWEAETSSTSAESQLAWQRQGFNWINNESQAQYLIAPPSLSPSLPLSLHPPSERSGEIMQNTFMPSAELNMGRTACSGCES